MRVLHFYILPALFLSLACAGNAGTVRMKITGRYLNIPVAARDERALMRFAVDGQPEREFRVRLASAAPDYHVFCDLSALRGKTLEISFAGNPAGLDAIRQSDEIAGADSMYRESNRPRFHFTARRGWTNDPNGLVFHDGEYHLFYQHNPYEREWENMHWGHAVSRDLMHWEELPLALSPDEHGTIFSGSAVIDRDNTAGFGSNAMIALYTADSPEKQVQCLAYSRDKGRTWTKYSGNPVLDTRARWNSKDTRDPKVFRYESGNHWVMVLNERDGHSVYTSSDLKQWTYQSHTTGFWECPDLFELPVDGDASRSKWVMYGASGTYMIGTFDGKQFTPESGKHYYTAGSLYAAQTFANIPPADGRRIQIGWGRIEQPGMPFNMMMLLPTELSLKTTRNGIRLFSVPARETELVFGTVAASARNISAADADALMSRFGDSACLRIKTTLKLSHATSAGIDLDGRRILDCDLNFNLINGVFYSPDEMTSMEISADIILDKTSVEVFIDNGAYSCSMPRSPRNGSGFAFWGNNIEIIELTVVTR
ncbi:MAG: 2,6-beta-D-fructofuranosidase [Prevotellaceae bacterium]|jgi:fructan beta-fructosidase|nr:2,6-beta-D-fructofuranosidase [Prevotellaceae bacterium]